MTPEDQAAFITRMMGAHLPAGVPPDQVSQSIAEAIRRQRGR